MVWNQQYFMSNLGSINAVDNETIRKVTNVVSKIFEPKKTWKIISSYSYSNKFQKQWKKRKTPKINGAASTRLTLRQCYQNETFIYKILDRVKWLSCFHVLKTHTKIMLEKLNISTRSQYFTPSHNVYALK